MVCNYCGNPFHYDERCLMNPNFRTAKHVPLNLHIMARETDAKLSIELFDRWIKGLKFN